MKRYRIPTHLTVEPSLVRAELGPIPVDLTFRQATALALRRRLRLLAVAGQRPADWRSSIALTLGGAGRWRSLAAFVTVGGRSADLWLRDAAPLHRPAPPARLAAGDAASPAAAPSGRLGRGRRSRSPGRRPARPRPAD